ncbi:Cro/CI family transcriptional regulator [Arsenophonus nasoniae]|uniref:Antitoxin of bacterial toxin-antitoxin system, YdaS/YdaT n=1 Tax=Arsenophonus nasoniae TaxID=638 RepID=D2U112_9GAMM|nr:MULTISPECIES: Cro/CI family transcriptional regulator [Arsenophonus]MDR5616818.1 Cro/CI family transcriptional regulator [Arsenophonus sp.]QBY43217.1 Putative antitoxin of bacterial toxin-antitoxin system, YdaS/YdaT [Arsenophonus nasoniae]QBY44007.1 Putative antitoxin of bacterial toxin-antitoxin system, YdaS/YdaT [Arsenophonus nasoniae]WGM04321.1 Cro/CI family transcriptional regulator [Arsenophonus nasoniae]WGM07233.1 Cro/CI family transcriptional regulator [Arsenophonus nasoniae]
MSALKKVINVTGTATRLAAALGVSNMTVSQWKNKYKGRVPVDRVLAIYELTGITPHELRPDIYPNPTDGIPADKQNTI